MPVTKREHALPAPTYLWEQRHIARGIVEALVLWSTPDYRRFLTTTEPPKIEREWFEKFLSEWSVARTLKKDSRDEVRKYLDTRLRLALANSCDGKDVDKAADHLKAKGWGSRKSEEENGSRPVSVVSKVGFFLAPARIAPFDSLALKGMNRLRGTKKTGGVGHLIGARYSEYLTAFESELKRAESKIKDEINASWVQELGAKLGVQPNETQSLAFQRKVFDNMLMSLAGRFD